MENLREMGTKTGLFDLYENNSYTLSAYSIIFSNTNYSNFASRFLIISKYFYVWY